MIILCKYNSVIVILCAYIEVTDWVTGSTQNVSLPIDQFLAKIASKTIVPPKEMLLLFSIGTFLTNYDVTCRKLNMF